MKEKKTNSTIFIIPTTATTTKNLRIIELVIKHLFILSYKQHKVFANTIMTNRPSDAVIALINFIILMLSSIIFAICYIKSVQPAAMEKRLLLEQQQHNNNNNKNKINNVYEICGRYRWISGLFMTIASINYFVYYAFPLPIIEEKNMLPVHFPWPYWLSVVFASIIGIPSSYLMYRGMVDAGEETMHPKKEHKLYNRGIYNYIRHPQALGEMPIWWTMSLLLHSPFLTIFSTCVYLPIWILFCYAEEKDLIIRYGTSYQDYRQRTGLFFPKQQQQQQQQRQQKSM